MLDFDALSKIVTSISAPITLCVALYGLKSWKNELRGKSQYGLARRLVLLTIKYQEAINYLRSPFFPTYADFMPTEDQAKSMTHTQVSDHLVQKSYDHRLDRLGEIKPALVEVIWETEVLWGSEITDIYNKVYNLERKVTNAIYQWIEDKDKRADMSDLRPEKLKRAEENNKLRLANLSEGDDISREFNSLLNEVKCKMQPHIKYLK